MIKIGQLIKIRQESIQKLTQKILACFVRIVAGLALIRRLLGRPLDHILSAKLKSL